MLFLDFNCLNLFTAELGTKQLKQTMPFN